MFAAHDQENLVSIHQAAANHKQHATARGLQPKTPGARYPKTPLKVPLNDENAVRGLGGKSVLANKTNADKSQWVTPAAGESRQPRVQSPESRVQSPSPLDKPPITNMSAYQYHTEPRTGRAVLGNKTTNAKARTHQTLNGKAPAVHELERSQVRPTTVSRPKPLAPKAESSKLQILLDHSDPLSDEVDTNSAPPPELPYESDVFPAGVLTFDAIRPENRMKGYYDYYHNRRDENGMTRLDREMRAMQEKRFREADARIRKDLDETEWDLGLDSPKKKLVPLPDAVDKKVARSVTAASKAPSTLTSRRAASALGMAPKSSTTLQRKPLSGRPAAPSTEPKLPSFMQPTKAKQTAATASTSTFATRPKAPSPATTNAGVAASRSTLGYNKGRNASSALHVRSRSEVVPSPALARPITTASEASDATITPSSCARDTAVQTKPEFVSIFDTSPPGDEAAEPEDGGDAALFGYVGDGAIFGTDDAVDKLAAGEEEEDDFRLELDL